jgi:PadR family transcriptional regulator
MRETIGDTLPLLKGTLDLLILKVLSVEATHGYGVAKWLEAHTGGSLGVDDSALYQALHRLEGRGFVDARWGKTDNKRRARWYSLTAKGRAHLRAEADTWRRYASSVQSVLAAEPRE